MTAGAARRNRVVDVATLVVAFGGAALVCREARVTPGFGLFVYAALTLLTARVVCLGVHELGHLVAAALGGFRWEVYKVGPLLLSRETGTLTVTLRGGRRFRAAGLVLTYPSSPEHDTPARHALMLAGGPVASALFAALAAALWRASDPPHVRVALGITAVFSAVVFVTTVLPFSSAGNASDGANIVALLRARNRERLSHAR